MSRRLLLFLLICALALVLGFWTFAPLQGMWIVRKGGYWLVLLATLCFAIALVRSLRDVGPDWRDWRRWKWPVAVALAATAFLHVHERHEFKIVADEPVLQSTARQMHFFREAAVVLRGYDYAGNFMPLLTFVDKRPLFFPFLVSVIHDVTGFRPGNVFILNAALSAGLMILLLLIGRRIDGWGAGIAAVLLMATVPLVAQNACGGGFELLNMVMILLVIWLGMRAAEAPANDDRLSAFVLSGVLLAQVRYESVIFVVPVGATVLYLWWRQRAIRLPWGLLVAPLLVVICALHLNVFKISQAAWQLDDVVGAGDPFSFKYFYDNVGHALNFFFSFDGSHPSSWLLAGAGILGAGFFVLSFYKRHRTIFSSEPAEAVLSLFILSLMAHTVVMMCYFWGKWDDPIIRRLSLPAHILLVLVIIYVVPRFTGHRRRWPALAIGALAYIVIFTVPSSAMHRFTRDNYAARTTNWIGNFVRRLDDRPVLAIDHNSGLQWLLHGKSNVTAPVVAARPEAFLLHFRNRTFADYFIVQRCRTDVKTGVRTVTPNDDFGDVFDLELIEERTFAPLYIVRLSRIVAIDEAKLLEWAEGRRKNPVKIKNVTTLTPEEGEHLLEWLRQLP